MDDVKSGQIKSPHETTESIFSESISLVSCPFLGLDQDPGTSLGYAHAANQCYRLEKPAGIDLAHQNKYCLCVNYTHCYVYAQHRPTSKSAKNKSNQPSMMADDPQPEVTGFPPPKRAKRHFRVLGLLAMLFLIGIAAIIWWPPPGISIEDVIVRGSSITKEVKQSGTTSSANNFRGEIDQDELTDTAAPAETSTGLNDEMAESGPEDQIAYTASAESGDALVDQEKISATTLTPLEKDTTSIKENIVVEEAGVANKSEFDNPVEDYSLIISEAADADDEAITVETENDESAGQAPNPQIATFEQPEQIEPEDSDSQDASEVSLPETNTSEIAPLEQESSSGPTVLKTAYIGPLSNATGLQETSQSPPLLYLHRHPGNGAEVLAMIPERQQVTVLGRNSNSEWLLVRLTSGVEGWVHATDSGASIVVSNLPVMDNVSGNVPAFTNQEQSTGPVVEKQDSAPEIGEPIIFGTAVIKTGALNLRSGPGLEYDSLGVGYNGQQVTLLEQFGSNIWIQIRLPDGKQGWVNSTYLAQTS
jgi:uncharacterized protein YgiM (DUF1202 family)